MDMMPNNPPMGDVKPAMPAKQPIKVAMASLPPGTKEGDMLELTVKSIDPVSNMVELAPEGEEKDEPKDTVTDDGEEEKSEGPAMDTKTLLGPMDGFKNYLVQKSQDVPKNQGH